MPKWSHDWPTEPGWYWLYGWMSKQGKEWFGSELYPVKARMASDRIMCSTAASILYRNSAGGLWIRAIVPELPKEDEQ